MAALWNRVGHYIFVLWFLLLSIFFFFFIYSQPWQIECLPYFHACCGLSANLGCMSETVKRAARGWLEIQDAKKSPKIAISAPSHNFVGLYLRN